MLRAVRGPGVPAPHLPRLVSKGQGAGWLVGQGVRSLRLRGSGEEPIVVVNLGNVNGSEGDW